MVDDTIRIWTIGDSITVGTNNGYRNQIWTNLTGAGNTVDFIGTQQHQWPVGACPDPDHDGYSGYSIVNIADAIDGLYQQVKSDDPEVVLIMLGTNDLAWWVGNREYVDDCDDRMIALAEHILERLGPPACLPHHRVLCFFYGGGRLIPPPKTTWQVQTW